jgi:hypothetical protein
MVLMFCVTFLAGMVYLSIWRRLSAGIIAVPRTDAQL